MCKSSLKKLFLSALFILIFCISIGYSQNNTKQLDKYSSIEVSIRFYDEQIYYLGDPIIVEFQIVNNGRDPYLFITSFKKIFTFDFDISSMTKKKVMHSNSYMIERRKYEPIFNDEIILKRNEVYGVRINIGEWFDFKESGEFVIKGILYPNLITESGNVIVTEKELYLNLNPPYTEIVREQQREKEILRLKTEKFPPYKVVELMLNALMAGDFEKYFLHINFEKFIHQFNNAERKYVGAKDIDKPSVIEELKNYIKAENTLESVPYSDTVPVDFEIVKTVIEKTDAQVTVIETFKYINLIEKKKYTYYLHLYADKWLFEQYDVVNIAR